MAHDGGDAGQRRRGADAVPLGLRPHPYPHPFRVPTMRPIEHGDMIICEMHPKFGGYFTHVERTFCLGEPEQASRNL